VMGKKNNSFKKSHFFFKRKVISKVTSAVRSAPSVENGG